MNFTNKEQKLYMLPIDEVLKLFHLEYLPNRTPEAIDAACKTIEALKISSKSKTLYLGQLLNLSEQDISRHYPSRNDVTSNNTIRDALNLIGVNPQGLSKNAELTALKTDAQSYIKYQHSIGQDDEVNDFIEDRIRSILGYNGVTPTLSDLNIQSINAIEKGIAQNTLSAKFSNTPPARTPTSSYSQDHISGTITEPTGLSNEL